MVIPHHSVIRGLTVLCDKTTNHTRHNRTIQLSCSLKLMAGKLWGDGRLRFQQSKVFYFQIWSFMNDDS